MAIPFCQAAQEPLPYSFIFKQKHMKTKLILLSTFVILFSSCKKEEPEAFKATDVSGNTTVKGYVSKNVITPDGNGGWTNSARIPAKGVTVSVKVNKSSLYPNSNAQGADVYSALTDDKGNYSLNVKSNAGGVVAQITVDGFTSTLDTLVNGQTKEGLISTFAGISFSTSLSMGQNFTYNYSFTASNGQSNPNSLQTGTAVVSGSVGLSMVKEIQTGTLISLTTAFLPLANHKVYLNLSKDPITQNTKLYETTTDGNGRFSINLNTVLQGSAGFTQSASLWINDYATTRDTVKLDNTIRTGRPGVYNGHTINLNGLFSSEIRNANYLQYTTFTPD